MLEEKILNDYKEAMKSKDTVKSSILSFLRAEIMNAALKKSKNSLDDAEIIVVIKKQIKQHEDSIQQFTAGNRQDLVEKETRELAILKAYVPPELSVDQIRQAVAQAIIDCAASGPRDMGKVMKEVLAKTAGQADGKLVSDLVREKLSGPQK
ncbi:MAG TPA: GatB/YqeY domain-containing protein [Patescibacteria group bacterium]|nr:GatB/YqeY domain-containing protein [Patescibacteria group bacterium]